jgi:hypothetical protein
LVGCAVMGIALALGNVLCVYFAQGCELHHTYEGCW